MHRAVPLYAAASYANPLLTREVSTAASFSVALLNLHRITAHAANAAARAGRVRQ